MDGIVLFFLYAIIVIVGLILILAVATFLLLVLSEILLKYQNKRDIQTKNSHDSAIRPD